VTRSADKPYFPAVPEEVRRAEYIALAKAWSPGGRYVHRPPTYEEFLSEKQRDREAVEALWPYRDDPTAQAKLVGRKWTAGQWARRRRLLAAAQSAPVLPDGRKPGRKPASGVRNLVRHLKDVEEVLDYHDILKVLRASDHPRVTETIKHWGIDQVRDAYGHSGARHASACGYCAGAPLPRPLVDAVARVRYGDLK
jgi:hypothetical protein